MEALPSCSLVYVNRQPKENLAFAFQVGSTGFVKPRHGIKGKQHWLVQDMYSVYKKRRVITLWCFRPIVGGAEPSLSRKQSLFEGQEGAAPRPKSHCL